jgi:hypothetical protein
MSDQLAGQLESLAHDPTRSRRANRRRAYMFERHTDGMPRYGQPTNKTERRADWTSAYVLPQPWRPSRSKRRRRDEERPSKLVQTVTTECTFQTHNLDTCLTCNPRRHRPTSDVPTSCTLSAQGKHVETDAHQRHNDHML